MRGCERDDDVGGDGDGGGGGIRWKRVLSAQVRGSDTVAAKGEVG